MQEKAQCRKGLQNKEDRKDVIACKDAITFHNYVKNVNETSEQINSETN